jgi:oligosaccharide repeat unit polymerase
MLFLLTSGSRGASDTSEPELPYERRLVAASLVALCLGSVLWGALFLRNGGIDALLNDPASLHLEQFSGGYGVVGMMICLATALLLLFVWLRSPTKRLWWTLLLATGVSVAASFALQTRGPLLASIVAGAAIVISANRLSGRSTVVFFMVALVVGIGFVYVRTVREYSQTEALGPAISASVRTHPLQLFASDFGEVENFVILEQLVPDSIPWLSGRSLRDVPAAFVPRRVWGEKPLPVDFELSEKIVGPGASAGTPFTLAGELFWNFGVPGTLVGMALLGGVVGLAWRLLGRGSSSAAALVSALLVGYSYLLLTRPLGPMLLTFAMALAGVAIVVALAGLVQLPSRGALVPGSSTSQRERGLNDGAAQPHAVDRERYDDARS